MACRSQGIRYGVQAMSTIKKTDQVKTLNAEKVGQRMCRVTG
jgi:hypothetical protein